MSKYPTPEYEIDDDTVYPPSEDTFLLMDALEKERNLIIKLRPALSVEIGSGSGVVTAFLHQLINSNNTNISSKSQLFSICTDINGKALRCTRRTFQLNSLPAEHLETVHCNISDPMVSRLKGAVDILLLNPPYIPTEKTAVDEKDFYYAGGSRGRHVLDSLLPCVAEILSQGGLFFAVALQENNVDELISVEMRNKYGLNACIVLERQCRSEHLYVLKYSRVVNNEKLMDKPISSAQRSSLNAVAKITLLLKPVGNAPQLKKEFTKYKVDPSSTIAHLQRILKKLLGIKNSESLFIFVRETFAPSPEHTVEALYECFGSNNGILYAQYSLTPAWG